MSSGSTSTVLLGGKVRYNSDPKILLGGSWPIVSTGISTWPGGDVSTH